MAKQTTQEFIKNGETMSFENASVFIFKIMSLTQHFINEIEEADRAMQISSISMLCEEYCKKYNLDVVEFLEELTKLARGVNECFGAY